MLVLSHRGYAADVPENTLDAFERAAEMGVDGIETDLRLSADGRVVLFHDRVAPGGAPVAALSRDELSRDAGYPVPTLEEALAARPDVLWMLELKAPAAAAATERVLRALGGARRTMVTSFHHDAARALAERLGVEGGAIVAHRPLPSDAGPFGLPVEPSALRSVVWRYDTFDEAVARRTAARGWRHWVYDLETAAEHEACLRLPLAGVVSDRPEHLLDR